MNPSAMRDAARKTPKLFGTFLLCACLLQAQATAVPAPADVRVRSFPAQLSAAHPSREQIADLTEAIEIDIHAGIHPFPHFWEKMFGSGRAILSLREDYRRDLRAVQHITGFGYVHFHAIFHDEVGLYDEDGHGNPTYNFSYVDQIYDGLFKNKIRPFVELSFMPRKLSSDPNALHAFWYKPNVAAPKDWSQWGQLIETFTRHLVERYGEKEVAEWYFEVWNEPNIDFWRGDPKESTYYELYDHAARAIKRVSQRLRVGGPATAQAAWVDRFLAHCKQENVPVDFVSSHVYGNDKPEHVFGTREPIPRNEMDCRAVKKVHEQIAESAYPNIPLMWTEFNADYGNHTEITDSAFMGPFLADTIRQCDGLAEAMSYWTFSDVFEEQGVVKAPFYGGFGLIAERGIPKPAFHAFALLHRLGHTRLDAASESVLVTRRQDGTMVDKEHGSPLPAYNKMGRPRFPTAAQIAELRKAAALPASRSRRMEKDSLTLTLEPQALALIEMGKPVRSANAPPAAGCRRDLRERR